MHSQAVAVGLDGDPEVLEIARAKALRAGTDIAFDLGLASELPYPDRSFDTVVSSLVIHHLSRPDKVQAMKQVHRVLKGGGEFHLADFGPPVGAYARVVSSLLRNLEQVGDNLDGRLPWLLRDAGFQDVTRTGRINSVFGTLELLVGAKPLGQD
jgi:ubiquinone/menaquinone biosynthesis C-methylase UbiE